MLDSLDRVPTFVQTVQFAVKQSTVGKAATFTKVDNVIQEVRVDSVHIINDVMQ